MVFEFGVIVEVTIADYPHLTAGRLEVLVVYVVLSLLAHFAFWSRIVSGLNQERT
jgi:hypothetical protein